MALAIMKRASTWTVCPTGGRPSSSTFGERLNREFSGMRAHYLYYGWGVSAPFLGEFEATEFPMTRLDKRILATAVFLMVVSGFSTVPSRVQAQVIIRHPSIPSSCIDNPAGCASGGGCTVPYGYTWGCQMACGLGRPGFFFCSSNGGVDPTTICMISPAPGSACFDDANDGCCGQNSSF
jgi:hypothetical protein